MTIPQHILNGEWVNALGWTVLHSLWQATVIALVIGLLLLRMQKRPAWQRYWVANLGWLGMLAGALITFIRYYQPLKEATVETIIRLETGGEAALLSSPSMLAQYLEMLSDYFNRHLPLIVSLWALGVAVFLLRFLGGLIYLQQLRSRRVQKLPEYWQIKLQEIRKKLRLRQPVQLLESVLIKTPLVIGWIKPVILMPIGALTALSPQQLEAVLAHELAHIKRYDYLLNLMRAFVEVLFYFNPAVWWLSAQIRIEREHCCDDMALAVCGDSLSYVRALVALQEMNNRPVAGLAMSFAGSRPELLNRVRRILNQPKEKSEIMEKFVITCLLLSCLSFTLLSAGFPAEGPAEKEVVVMVEAPAGRDPVAVQENLYASEREIVVELQEIPWDTLPRGATHLEMTKNGKSYDVRIRNNKIQELSIDGKAVPENELVNYYDLVQSLLDEVPEPLAPPVPPAAPSPVAAPAPVAEPTPPPHPLHPDRQPTPPAPVAVPTPLAAPAPPAAAPPPPPPPAPRIRLEKPVGAEEEGQGYSYRFKTAETGEEIAMLQRDLVWQSSEDKIPAPGVNGVADTELERVRVRVNRNAWTYAIAEDADVEIDLEAGSSSVQAFAPAERVFVRNDKGELYALAVSPAAAPAPGANAAWKTRLEEQMRADKLLPESGNYEVMLKAEQLLINGVPQSRAVYDKYVKLLEEAAGKTVGTDAYFFFNAGNRRME